MPWRLCTVSFQSPTGVRHGVDVEAETVYEAAGIGLARLTSDGWIQGFGPGSRLKIQVREPSTVHSLRVQQLHRCVDGVATSPPTCCAAPASTSCSESDQGSRGRASYSQRVDGLGPRLRHLTKACPTRQEALCWSGSYPWSRTPRRT